jgi:hypothetical protein
LRLEGGGGFWMHGVGFAGWTYLFAGKLHGEGLWEFNVQGCLNNGLIFMELL